MTSVNKNPKVVQRLVALCMWVAVIALIVMTVIIGWQVFGRFILNDTPKWTEQLAGVLMVYLTMFGAAACVSDDGLIALDIFRNKLPDRIQFALKLACEALVLAFSIILLVYGVKMASLVADWYIPTLGVPRTVMYATFPVAGALMSIFSAVRIKSIVSHS